MRERRAANALLGMAAGEALAELLHRDKKNLSVLLNQERLPKPQVDFSCTPNTAPLPGLHGNCTQMALLLRSIQKEQGITDAQMSISTLRDILNRESDVIRNEDPLAESLRNSKKRRNPSLAGAAWLSSISVSFNKVETMIPWVISWMQALTTNPLSIACGVDYSALCWALSRGLERQDAIEIMKKWRDSSQAMQSPVPDKHWWILNQAFLINSNYKKNEMLEFLDAALGPDMALSAETVAFYTDAIGTGISSRDYRAVMERLAKQQTESSLFGALCGAVAALSGKTPPNWLRDALPAYNQIISETEWSINSERKWNQAICEYQKTLPATLQRKKRRQNTRTKNNSQMTLFNQGLEN